MALTYESIVCAGRDIEAGNVTKTIGAMHGDGSVTWEHQRRLLVFAASKLGRSRTIRRGRVLIDLWL